MYERQYDSRLREDALAAMEHLFVHDPETLLSARSAADPIPPKIAARRIVNGGRVTAADAHALLHAAAQRGFVATEPDLPLTYYGELFDKAEAAVAFFWAEDPEALVELVGPAVRLAPVPATAIVSTTMDLEPPAPTGREACARSA